MSASNVEMNNEELIAILTKAFKQKGYLYDNTTIEIIPSKDNVFHRTIGTVDPNDGKWSNERLDTYGLGGCYTILIYTRNNEESNGILTHYDNASLKDNRRKLKQLLNEHPEMKDASMKKAVILYPQVYDDEGWLTNDINFLECIIKEGLGDINIEKKEYSTLRQLGDNMFGKVRYNIKDAEWLNSDGRYFF